MTVTPILVDARTFDLIAPRIIAEVQAASFIGLDCETQDDARHEGLNQLMNIDPVTRKKKGKKLVFDMRRTVMTGFSIHPKGSEFAYYVNLAHADVENRLPWAKAVQLLEAKRPEAYWICHNAPFEITAFSLCHGFELEQIVCTLQMCVSAWGPDEYSIERFIEAGMGGMQKLLGRIIAAARGYNGDRNNMTPQQAEVFAQIVGKSSKADHSYNGFVKSIAYGYGLKDVVRNRFGYDMTTFEQVLGDKAHMGQLTGEETVAYGADDAYWALRIFDDVLAYMAQNYPETIQAFFDQENPMVHLYADMWQQGIKVNSQAITERRQNERAECAKVLRLLKAAIRDLLPFKDEPHETLLEYEKWYRNGYQNYRSRIEAWANLPDVEDDRLQCLQAGGAVGNAWAAETGEPKPTGPNFTHYMMMRTLLYDLAGLKVIKSKGKIQSNAEARGRMWERAEKRIRDLESGEEIIDGEEDDDDEDGVDEEVPELERLDTSKKILAAIVLLAGIEQRMKLYLTPYERLKDPETGRMYPIVSSKLATRRLAGESPNQMQLGKKGESSYIRGFFEADIVEAPNVIRPLEYLDVKPGDQHLILSRDWSAIELVLIGDFSGDPEFHKAYHKTPHEDLHLGAASSLLGVTDDVMKMLKGLPDDYPEREFMGIPLVDHRGKKLTPAECYSYNRGTDGGKGANFNYWYSGALSSIGEKRGWSPDKMWEATERYRERFAVAEEWRVNLIHFGQEHGYAPLPDGHRRVRFEATDKWRHLFRSKFLHIEDDGFQAFIESVIKAISSRANNQIVNAVIQGSCATIAKRTMLRMRKRAQELGWDRRIVRLIMPVHDELVFSVHPRYLLEVDAELSKIMCDHKDIIRTLEPYSTPSIGLTFEPFHLTKAPYGQIELAEAPLLPGVLPEDTRGKALTQDQVLAVVDYLTHNQHKRMAA